MRVLAIAAHPDDETLGAGGTLAKHAARGDEVRVLFMCTGLPNEPPESERCMEKQNRARLAVVSLGAVDCAFFGLADQRLDQIALLDLTQRIERYAGHPVPDIVYTHHLGDLNADHRITAQATLTAFRPVPGSKVRALLSFEVPSATEYSPPHNGFSPNVFVDLEPGFLARKLKGLACYETEMRPAPHPRSVESVRALATMRGSSIGVAAAEAFELVRGVA
jgi:LmbE family N-acetylglucosaminyl deacetylase